MKKNLVLTFAPFVMLPFVFACSSNLTVNLGEEFVLGTGQTVTINGEDLKITFIEVTEDSRCPRTVTCIWEGRAVAVANITMNGESERLELIEPGLVATPSGLTYGRYNMDYSIEPYPEAEKEIVADEYRLILTVRR